MKSKSIGAVLVAAATLAAATSVFASAITPGDLVVYQVGTGAAALTSAATATFLDEYSTAGGTAVQQIASPTAASGLNYALTNSGTATSEGELSISANGTYIAFAGYNAVPGTAGVTSSASATTARVVGILNTTTGSIDTTTGLTDAYTGNNIRAAYTDGTNIYTAGTSTTQGGIHYTTVGSTTSTILTPSSGTAGANTGNFRTVQVYNGQLYASSTSSTIPLYGVGAVGTGTPTTSGQTVTQLGVDSVSGQSPYSFVIESLGGTPLDTVYMADSGVGIEKYSLESGSYVETGSVALAGVTGLTANDVSGVVSLYATTTTNLDELTDSSGFGGTLGGTPTVLETAATNTQFRGVALVPAAVTAPEPASLSLMAIAGGAVLARRRRLA